MSNLIREQRVDKNGVLTTKHVRAGAKSSTAKVSMPAPQLPSAIPVLAARTYKAPTAGQLKRESRSFTASLENPDPQLLEALGLPPTRELGIYRFIASTNDLYEMMARTSTGNALALIQAGYKSAPEAMQFLSEKDMDHLKEPRSMALEAQERRIPVEDFIRETRDAPQDRLNHPNFMDYMEVTGIAAFREFHDLPGEVFHGEIKLSDLKTVGVTRIGKSVGWNVIEEALRRIADESAGYTADDLRLVLTRFAGTSDAYIENAIELTEKYGSEFMTTIENPSGLLMQVEAGMREKGTDPERIKGILKFRDDFTTETASFDIPFTDEEIDQFYDANVIPSDAATGKVTLMQLDAINEHGINPSISGGWL